MTHIIRLANSFGCGFVLYEAVFLPEGWRGRVETQHGLSLPIEFPFELFTETDDYSKASRRAAETSMKLVDVARRCGVIFDRAAAVDPDLMGGSLLDLLADNLPYVSLEDLKAAVIVAGIFGKANARIQDQIRRYNIGFLAAVEKAAVEGTAGR